MKSSLKTSRQSPYLTSVYVRTSHWFQYHPRTVRHAMRVSMLFMIGFTLLNAGLFSVQNGRTSALTTLNGKSYGLMPIKDAEQLLQTEHSNVRLTVRIGNKTVVLNAKQAGVTIDAEKTFSSFTDIKGWQRVPLVSAMGNLFAGIKPAYHVNMAELESTITPHITQSLIPAQNASATIPSDIDEAVVITPAVRGSEISAAVATEQLARAIAANDFTMRVNGVVIPATWTELELRAFMPAIDAARRTSLNIQADNTKVHVSSTVLTSMLRIDYTGTVLKMTLDPVQLQTFLVNQSQVFYTAPIATKTVQRDGTETSRTEGIVGKQLDIDATTAAAIAAFENGILQVTPTFATVTPQILVTRTYSNTDTGLYKTIEDFALTHKGSYRVAAVQLSGTGNRSAFYNPDQKIITASTFKLFVAYGIMQKIDAGELTMGSIVANSTVESCMYKMIHFSDNNCGKALQLQLGWATFDSKLASDGFTATKLNNSSAGDKWSTARDEMSLLTKLYNHELLTSESTDYLLNLMKNQIYRSGIPAGSRGAVVANKVGYLYGLTHDIGIVYSPKATYAVAIMTDGSAGWTNIKQLSQLIHDFYNQ